jgi:RNase P subunit RPR2
MRREEFTEFAPLAIVMNRRTCPTCRSRLILTGIEFSLSGVDLQTFHCAICAHVERVAVPAGED